MKNIKSILNFGEKSMNQLLNQTKVLNNNFVDAIHSSGKLLGRSQNPESENNQFLQEHTQQQMENQKQQLRKQLEQLDKETYEIKEQSNSLNIFQRRQKISNSQEARKNAEKFIKQIQEQKKYREHRKKIQEQKSRIKVKIDEDDKKKQAEEKIQRQKIQKRKAIFRRLQEEQRKKQERRIIEMESNKLIAKLKEEQKIQKFVIDGPEKLLNFRSMSRILQKRKRLDIQEIAEHEKKYIQLRQDKSEERLQKATLSKVGLNSSLRYPKNIWKKKLQIEERKKKLSQMKEDEKRRSICERKEQYNHFLQTSLPGIKKNNSFHEERNEEDLQKKMREFKVRKETSERLKSIKKKSLELMERKERVQRYHNYLGKFKKKQKQREQQNQSEKEQSDKYSEIYVDVGEGWQQILKNGSITPNLKYEILKKKAEDLDMIVKAKEEQGELAIDDEAANLYLNSINTKLAILTKI